MTENQQPKKEKIYVIGVDKINVNHLAEKLIEDGYKDGEFEIIEVNSADDIPKGLLNGFKEQAKTVLPYEIINRDEFFYDFSLEIKEEEKHKKSRQHSQRNFNKFQGKQHHSIPKRHFKPRGRR